jgi:ribosomal protein L7/L12
MNYYKRAIEIVRGGNTEDILTAVLASNPGAIVRAVDGPAEKAKRQARSALEAECIALYRSGHKIDAIKLWRSHTGAPLKDAKEAVEKLAADA